MKRTKKHKKRSCYSKMGYKSKASAYAARRILIKKNFIFHKLQIYKCKYCKLWHVGRSSQVLYDVFKRLK